MGTKCFDYDYTMCWILSRPYMVIGGGPQFPRNNLLKRELFNMSTEHVNINVKKQ